MDGVVRAYQQLGDKVPPRGLHHLPVVVPHQNILNAVAPLHQPCPVRCRGQQRGGGAGDKAGGVDIKGEGGGDGAQFLRPPGAKGQKGAMAKMNAVKKA